MIFFKKTIFTLLLVFQFGLSVAQASDFIITRDTIKVDIEGRQRHSLIVGDKYYCFFEPVAPSGNSFLEKKMYIISSNGKVEHCIDSLPKDFSLSYPDFYLKNDSIFYKIYYDDKDVYLFDIKHLTWNTISPQNDFIYEDSDYYITSLDFGEWGSATWFKDKMTDKEYRLAASQPVINKLNGIYYLTLENRILTITDPHLLHECSPNQYYQYTVDNKKYYDELYFRDGINTIFKDDTWNPFRYEKCKKHIKGSFVYEDKLYHLLVENCKLYIATLEGNTLEKKVELDVQVTSYINNYRSLIQKDGSQTFTFNTQDSKMSGLIHAKGDSINLHYIDNAYFLKFEPRGKIWSDTFFQDFFSSIFSNYGNMDFDQIRDFQKNTNNAIHTEETINTNRNQKILSFSIVEDSIFTHELTYNYSIEDKYPNSSIYSWKAQTHMQPEEKLERTRKKYTNRFTEISQFITSYLEENKLLASQHSNKDGNIVWETNRNLSINLGARRFIGTTGFTEIRLFVNQTK